MVYNKNRSFHLIDRLIKAQCNIIRHQTWPTITVVGFGSGDQFSKANIAWPRPVSTVYNCHDRSFVKKMKKISAHYRHAQC